MAAAINDYIDSRRYGEELTEDLWIQIFIRLSVKPLVRVMCVCEDWYVLVKDSNFRRKHLQFQKSASKNNGHLLLLHPKECSWAISRFLFDAKSIANSMTFLLPLSSYPEILPFSRIKEVLIFNIDGPINGLYCVHNEAGHVVLWNPATIEVGFAPFPEECIPPDFNYDERYLSDSVIGFGVDPMYEDNYKVILFSRCLDACSDDEFLYVMLYTTRKNTWRRFDDAFMVVRSLNNTYLNGFYYWKGENCTAVVFDMSEKEAFRKIPTPCDGELALHNDHLTLFCVDKNLNEIEIWVMLEENDWFKTISVGGIQRHVVKPLGFCNTENELFIVTDYFEYDRESQIMRYNTATREIQRFGTRGCNSDFKALVYYESFVSLGGAITKYKGIDYVSFIDKVRDFLLEEYPDF